MEENYTSYLDPIYKIHRDMIEMIRNGGKNGIGSNEARLLVDIYYSMQQTRVGLNNQAKGLVRDAVKAGTKQEPHEAIDWILGQAGVLENQVKKVLAAYTETHEMAWFFDQTIGIGPVIAAGLLAHIDIKKAPTAGHIWRFAGLDPTMEWEKKTKRPWNAQLKTICWKIGESFVKVSGNPKAFYGQVYKARKEYENKRNDAGELADQAKAKLEKFKIGKTTDAYQYYSTGKLPPAHIHSRAKRYAVKLFLSHLQNRWWEETYGEAPPKPYVIAILEHAHFIDPPQVKGE